MVPVPVLVKVPVLVTLPAVPVFSNVSALVTLPAVPVLVKVPPALLVTSRTSPALAKVPLFATSPIIVPALANSAAEAISTSPFVPVLISPALVKVPLLAVTLPDISLLFVKLPLAVTAAEIVPSFTEPSAAVTLPPEIVPSLSNLPESVPPVLVTVAPVLTVKALSADIVPVLVTVAFAAMLIVPCSIVPLLAEPSAILTMPSPVILPALEAVLPSSSFPKSIVPEFLIALSFSPPAKLIVPAFSIPFSMIRLSAEPFNSAPEAIFKLPWVIVLTASVTPPIIVVVPVPVMPPSMMLLPERFSLPLLATSVSLPLNVTLPRFNVPSLDRAVSLFSKTVSVTFNLPLSFTAKAVSKLATLPSLPLTFRVKPSATVMPSFSLPDKVWPFILRFSSVIPLLRLVVPIASSKSS